METGTIVFICIVVACGFIAWKEVRERRFEEQSKGNAEWTDTRVGVARVNSYHYHDKRGGMRRYNIEVTVHGEDGSTFDSIVRAKVSRRKLDALGPELIFPVMYSKEDRYNFVHVARGQHLQRGIAFFTDFCRHHGLIDEASERADRMGIPFTGYLRSLKIVEMCELGGAFYDIDVAVDFRDGSVTTMRSRQRLTKYSAELMRKTKELDCKVHLPTQSLVVRVPRNSKEMRYR